MRIATTAAVIAAAMAASASAQEIGARPIEKGTPVVIIGEVSSQPRDFGFFNERKMQVAVGPEKVDHTLHLRDAKFFDPQGREIAKSDFQDKWWVRAEGVVMSDPRRIDVKRIVVLGKDYNAFRQSAYFRPDFERGFVMAERVAGSREVLPSTRVFAPGTPVQLLAPISSQPKDAGVATEEKMQVAIGPDKTDYTLHFKNATMIGLDGKELTARDLRDRMWVRAYGKVMDDSRRIEVDRLELVASDDETFRSGPHFRQGADYGYIIAHTRK